MHHIRVGAVLFVLASVAGSAAPTVPVGWTRTEAAGVVTLTPPGLPPDAVCKVLLPRPEPLPQPDPRPWFGIAWQALKMRYQDIKETPPATSTRTGRVITIIAGSMADERGRFVYVSFAAVAKGNLVQPALFIADSSQRYAQYSQAFASIVADLDVTDFGGRRAVPLASGGWIALLESATPAQPPAPPAARPPSPGARTVASELVGNWGDTAVPVTAFYNPATGQWGDPPGNIESWSLRGDGTYVHARSMQTLMKACRITMDTWDEGAWSVESGVLTTEMRRAFVKSFNTCNFGPAFNYERTGKIETQRTAYRLENGGTVLVLKRPGLEVRVTRR